MLRSCCITSNSLPWLVTAVRRVPLRTSRPQTLPSSVQSSVALQQRIPTYCNFRHFQTSHNTLQNDKSALPFETKKDADSFLSNLSHEQKSLLYHSLHYEVLRDRYMNESACESHYLSKFGRPAADMGHPDDSSKSADSSGQLLQTSGMVSGLVSGAGGDGLHGTNALTSRTYGMVGLKNALPFVGFGFLDNLIMILAGDYIDLTIGATLGISTMAAAALGNTVSDVAGIASAWYVELFAEKIGLREPALTPAQLASSGIRWASNLGRALGVVIGCLLGMVPLLFLPSAEEKKEREAAKVAAAAAAAAANAESK